MSETFWVNVWRGEDGEPVVHEVPCYSRSNAVLASHYRHLSLIRRNLPRQEVSYRLKVTIKEGRERG